MKHKILGIAVLLCAVFLAACSDLVDELTPKETYYKIEIPSEIENGKVSADRTSARTGDTIKLTLTASEGYRFSELTVTGANNAAVPVTAIKTGEVYTFTMPASAVKISAAFIPIPTYKVTFSTDSGTEAAEQTVEENGRAEKPSNPAKDGFTFAGWYTSADGGTTLSETVFDFNTPITADITLYAKWIDATVPVYKVTIADGIENGTVSASADTAAEGTIITLAAAPASGYTLSAYSVKDAEGNPVFVTTGGSFTMPASNVTVYATFTELPPDAANYTVKHLFQKVDASGYEQNTSDYPDETKAGKAGDQTAASAKTVTGFTAIVIQKTIEADGSTVVEIKYDRVSHIVTYDDGADDDDIAVPEDTFCLYGQAVTVSFTGIGTRPGYLFTGWKQGDATYTSNGVTSFTMGDSPVTLTAQWTKIGTTFAVTISESTGDFSLESAADGTKLTFTAVGTDSGANLVWKVYKDNTALADAAYKQSGPNTAFSFDTGNLEAGSYTLFVTSGTRSAAAVFTVPEPVATLKTGSEINAILNTFGKTTITQFAKSGTNKEGATEYLDIDKKIPVWLDGTVVYYYVPDGTTVYMNEDSAEMFRGCQKLTDIDIAGFDTSSVTNMANMFYDCQALASLDVAGFNTSKVTNMANMFYNCQRIASLDVAGFDTSSVTNMANMFYNCQELASLDVSKFDTGKVSDMSSMFYRCSNLRSLDVSKFDTSSVTSMKEMFHSCYRVTSLDVSKFDTSSVTDMTSMFENCSGFASLDVSKFNTSKVTNMSNMFHGCNSLKSLDVSKFDTSSVTNMSSMFGYCTGLESLDVSKFDTSKVTDMTTMFYGCSKLTGLDVSKFDTSSVEKMSGMFSGCSGLTSLDLSKFDTGKVTNMGCMFKGCSELTSLDVSKFDTRNVKFMDEMFYSCNKLESLDLSSFDTSNVKNMSSMFYQCSALTTIYATDKFVTTSVTTGYSCFYDCNSLKGGAGTTHSFSQVSAEYARIDGGNSAPGYFTLKPIGSKSKPDAVGDIVFSDGSATPYKAYLTLTEEQKSKAVAVIYYAGSAESVLGAKTLGVGLKNTGTDNTLAWAKNGVNGSGTKITAIQCKPSEYGSGRAATAKFTDDLDGSDNGKALCEAVSDEGTSGNYPAWEWVNAYAMTANLKGDYASGWYLPTIAELCMLYREKDTVNSALEKAGGTKIADTGYWSSSQYASDNGSAWDVWFPDGTLYYIGKAASVSVCPVRAF